MPVAAVELFGVQLQTTNRDELRGAVQQSGATLISEGNDEQWFDVYDSSTLLPGSRRLYLGFVRSNGAFSFAEYEFPGLVTDRLLSMMEGKYGPANEVRKGRFLSDQRFIWSRDDLNIELFSDWSNYRVLLSYQNASNLLQLQAEQQDAMRSPGDISLY